MAIAIAVHGESVDANQGVWIIRGCEPPVSISVPIHGKGENWGRGMEL
jgi:hypothetical protein